MTEHEIIAENKRLKKEVEDKEKAYNDEFCLRKEWQRRCRELLEEKQNAKSEVIKEFAERLTDIICDNLNRSLDNPNGNDYFITDVYTTINNLVKEITEENK